MDEKDFLAAMFSKEVNLFAMKMLGWLVVTTILAGLTRSQLVLLVGYIGMTIWAIREIMQLRREVLRAGGRQESEERK